MSIQLRAFDLLRKKDSRSPRFRMPKLFGILLAALLLVSMPAAAQIGAPALLQQLGSKLVGSGAGGTPQQGISVSLSADGNTAAVGGYQDGFGRGAVWIYTKSGATWTQQGGKLVGTGAAGSNSWQGYSVALSGNGNTVIVGARVENGNNGAVWVFTRTAGVWSQQGGKLVGSGGVGTPQQGSSVAVSADGNTFVEGGFTDNGSVGAAWVFTRSGGVWSQQGLKLAGAGNTGASEQGNSVGISADGNTVLIGGFNDNGGVGAAWTFTRSAGTWAPQAGPIVASDETGSANLGYSASLSADGETALIGGLNDNGGAGAAWIFTQSGGNWSQVGNKLVGSGAIGAANQGHSVALSADGNTAIVGGYSDNGTVGASWVFTQNAGVWSQLGNKLVGTGEAGLSVLGYSVAISGNGNEALAGGNGDNSSQGAAWAFDTGTSFGPLNVGSNTTQTISVQFTSNFLLGSIGVFTKGNPSLDYTLAAVQPSSGACVVGTSFVAGDTCSVNVQFAPTAPGGRTGAIIFDDDCNFEFGGAVYISGVGLAPQANFVGGVISTIAGNGTAGYSGDGGQPTGAQLSGAYGLSVDGFNNLFISDPFNNAVREIPVNSALIETIAGNGTAGYTGDGAAATAALLQDPAASAVDGAGNFFFADSVNNVIREINASTGFISTVAGNGTLGFSGDGGSALAAEMNNPSSIAMDSSGNLYITDTTNNVIRRVGAITGIITTVAGISGSANFSGDGGPAGGAEIGRPDDVAVDVSGNLYFGDLANHVVRKIDGSSGIITTVAGVAGSAGYSGDKGPATSAQLNMPDGLALDSAGNLYIADSGNNVVRKLTAATGVITTVVGDGTAAAGYSGDGGSATSALLSLPRTAMIDTTGNLYVGDFSNFVVREVSGVAPLVFGTVNIGSGSPAQDIILTNDGNAPLTISSLAPTVNFDLSGTDTTCTGSITLAPGISCILGVVFAPTSAGNLIGSIGIADNAGTQTVLLSGTGALVSTATALTSSQNPAFVGQSVTFTATVSPAPTGSSLGTVDFFIGGTTLLGSGSVDSSGIATFTTTTLAIGSDSITATYSGNAGFATSTSSSLTQVVMALTSTTAQLTSSANPTASGQSITFTATVTPTPTGSPLGTVDFFNGSSLIGSGNVDSSGVATFTTSSLPVATNSITATYNGNADFASATSTAVSEIVTAATTTTVLSAAPNPAVFGQSVTFTATVSPIPTGTPLGTVDFLNGATVLGSGIVNSSGVATFATSSLPVGSNSITASYSGNTNDAGSTSSALSETITTVVTTTVLSAAPNPAVAGQSVTFTATVSPIPTGTPLGTVDFLNGATVLGSGIVNSSGVATFATSSLPVGSNSMTASYSGNTNDAGSTSSSLSETITAVVTATSLSASPNPAVAGQTITFTATVTPIPTGTPLGTVNFFNGATLLGSGVVNTSGVATFTSNSIPVGTNSITATYSGNTTSATSTSAAVSESVTLIVTTTALSASPNPAIAGQTITFTATVTPIPTGTPLGTVNFFNGATLLGSGVVSSSGIATFTSNSIPVGTNSITATYSGNTTSAASNSTPTSEIVALATTTTTLTGSPNPIVSGQQVTFTATVVPAPTGSPLGTVSFFSGPTVIGTGNVNASGIATLATSSLASGPNSISAVYSGNAGFASSTSSPTTETVMATTTTALGSSQNPSTSGQSVTFIGSVTPHPTGSPLGTVSFFNNATLMGSAPLNASGSATFATAALQSGSDNITATYSGNAGFATSTSAATSQTVTFITTTTLTASPTPGVASQPLTFTASVFPIPTGTTAGTVNFNNGATLLGTATVNSSGLATFVTSNLAAGTYSITATYSGNAGSDASTSAGLTVTVASVASFTITAPQGPFNVAPGGSIKISISVPPLGGSFNSVVTMSATGLPLGAVATFNPPTVTPGSAGATTVMTIQLAAGTSSAAPTHATPLPLMPFGLVLVACGMFCALKKFKTVRLGFAFGALAGIAILLTSCNGGLGASPNPSTTAASSVITVTGTSGTQHASTTFTLTVQ